MIDKNKVYCMDCIEFMRKLPDDSVDACATDPPYGLEFMQSAFDKIGVRSVMQQWHYDWAVEAFRVLKPGAHLLAFSGTRTYHRLACAIEDAGFEVRNMIVWIMGSGFPKGLNVSFGIMQKQLYKWLEDYPKKREKLRSLKGTERRQYMIELMVEADIAEVLDRAPLPWNERKQYTDIRGGRLHRADGEHKHTSYQYIMPKTPEAKEWYGFNTQLKPAIEPIVFARKPISEKSIVDNVLIHGTAAINIDACRIAVNPDVDAVGKTTKRGIREAETWREGSGFKNTENLMAGVLPTGRYPANLILSHHPDCRMIQEGHTKVKHTKREAIETTGKGIYSDGWIRNPDEYSFDAGEPEVWQCVEGCPVRILNEQSGDTKYAVTDKLDHVDSKTPILGSKDIYGLFEAPRIVQRYGGSGGAARFFYCAKPSVAERNAFGTRLYRLKSKTLNKIREEIMTFLKSLKGESNG